MRNIKGKLYASSVVISSAILGTQKTCAVSRLADEQFLLLYVRKDIFCEYILKFDEKYNGETICQQFGNIFRNSRCAENLPSVSPGRCANLVIVCCRYAGIWKQHADCCLGYIILKL